LGPLPVLAEYTGSVATMICGKSRAPIAIHRRFRLLLAVLPLLILAAAFAGCSKAGPSKSISSTSFDSAPAEVKKMWGDGLAAWKTHRYQEAATIFAALQKPATQLSPQQKEDLTKAVDEFGQEVFAVANKGDAEATKAVQTLRGAGRRSAGGR
jgi:hypothetical protein